MTRLPNFYTPPMGLPLYWRDEQTGELPAAVDAYLSVCISGRHTEISQTQLSLVRDYFEYHINAPCWLRYGNEFEPEITALRARIKTAATVEDLRAYVNEAMEIALDPL